MSTIKSTLFPPFLSFHLIYKRIIHWRYSSCGCYKGIETKWLILNDAIICLRDYVNNICFKQFITPWRGWTLLEYNEKTMDASAKLKKCLCSSTNNVFALGTDTLFENAVSMKFVNQEFCTNYYPRIFNKLLLSNRNVVRQVCFPGVYYCIT